MNYSKVQKKMSTAALATHVNPHIKICYEILIQLLFNLINVPWNLVVELLDGGWLVDIDYFDITSSLHSARRCLQLVVRLKVRQNSLYLVLSQSAGRADFSYLELCWTGMSVTAGEFFASSQMVFAAGAPRAGGTGQVVLFSRRPLADATVHTLNVLQIIRGEQFASSFGYEVATADVNGDK